MIYSVRANLIDERATKFLRNLTDGTIAQQKSEGGEIVASMERARITDDGYVCWREACYCPTSLKHERDPIGSAFFGDRDNSC